MDAQVEEALEEKILEDSMADSIFLCDEAEIRRASDREYTYRNEVKDTKYKWTKEAVCGKQPQGGTKFKSGGGMYYDPDGGPNVSYSVSFAGVKVPLSIGIGISSPTSVGYFADAPDTTHFFKLYARKNMKVQKVVTYRKNRKTGEETVYMTTYPDTTYQFEFYLKQV